LHHYFHDIWSYNNTSRPPAHLTEVLGLGFFVFIGPTLTQTKNRVTCNPPIRMESLVLEVTGSTKNVSPETRRGRVKNHLPRLVWVLIYVHKRGVKSKTKIKLPKHLLCKHDYPLGRSKTYSTKLPLWDHRHNHCMNLSYFGGFRVHGT
jgi:hypothetical protein